MNKIPHVERSTYLHDVTRESDSDDADFHENKIQTMEWSINHEAIRREKSRKMM